MGFAMGRRLGRVAPWWLLRLSAASGSGCSAWIVLHEVLYVSAILLFVGKSYCVTSKQRNKRSYAVTSHFL